MAFQPEAAQVAIVAAFDHAGTKVSLKIGVMRLAIFVGLPLLCGLLCTVVLSSAVHAYYADEADEQGQSVRHALATQCLATTGSTDCISEGLGLPAPLVRRGPAGQGPPSARGLSDRGRPR